MQLPVPVAGAMTDPGHRACPVRPAPEGGDLHALRTVVGHRCCSRRRGWRHRLEQPPVARPSTIHGVRRSIGPNEKTSRGRAAGGGRRAAGGGRPRESGRWAYHRPSHIGGRFSVKAAWYSL
jgi:hypothetical protein